jgi:hypothetical protein
MVHLDEAVLDAEKEHPDSSKMNWLSYLPIVGEYWTLSEKIQS